MGPGRRSGNHSIVPTKQLVLSSDGLRGRGARPMILTGVVRHGDKRGRTLGFPTANVDVGTTALPDHGVYAGRLDRRPAAISVGVRPTFGDGLLPLLEVYVLDFAGDLYGRRVTVELLERLRGELRFDDVDALVAQMHRDVEAVRQLLAIGAAPAEPGSHC